MMRIVLLSALMPSLATMEKWPEASRFRCMSAERVGMEGWPRYLEASSQKTVLQSLGGMEEGWVEWAEKG